MKKNSLNTLLLLVCVLAVPAFVSAQNNRSNSTLTTPAPGTNSTLTTPAPGTNSTLTTPAPGANNGNKAFTLQNPLSNKVTSIAGLVQAFVDVLSYILILFAVLMLVYTGLQYILAQGNSEKIKELHKKLLWIVVGVAIVIGARIIVQVVISTLQTTNVINSSTLQSVQNAANGQ